MCLNQRTFYLEIRIANIAFNLFNGKIQHETISIFNITVVLVNSKKWIMEQALMNDHNAIVMQLSLKPAATAGK